MMNEMKRCLKLYRYSYGMKRCLVFAVIFEIIAILMLFVNGLSALGGVYLMLGPGMLIQSFLSLELSGMVASSPFRKSMFWRGINLFYLVISFVSYALMVFLTWVNYRIHPLQEGSFSETLILEALFYTMVLIYMSISYKYFVVATIGFFLTFYTGFTYTLLNAFPSISGVMAVAAGVLIIMAATVLSAFIRRLLYKKPLSRWALDSRLRIWK